MHLHQLLVLLVVAVACTQASRSLSRPVRQYSGNSGVGYRSGSAGRLSSGSSRSRTSEIKRCIDIHEVANGQTVCGFSGCRMRCLPGYSFIETESERTRTVMLSCDHNTGDMKFRGEIWNPAMTVCSPLCQKTCENGGRCVAPNKCECRGPYTGDTCSEEPMLGDQPYRGYQPNSLFLNQRRVECKPGTRMPDGSTSITLSYRDNSWFFPDGRMMLGVDQVTCRKVSSSVEPNKPSVQNPSQTNKPNPEPFVARPTEYVPPPSVGDNRVSTRAPGYVCSSPCLNGGTCVYTNTCSCPRGYWGPTCSANTCTYPRFQSNINASLGGTLSRMKFECHPGFYTKAGRDRVVVLCSGGTWRLPNGRLLAEDDVKCTRSFPEK
uniref:Neurogenic locus notch homolog protein 1-like n=2 Tax=Hirondellea gigas TaxID=1518452 RepID=A0A2P2HW65_9CRUS